jgi:hypothetical protein
MFKISRTFCLCFQISKITVSVNDTISSDTRSVSVYYYYYYYYSFGGSKDLSCCSRNLLRKFRIVPTESQNHVVSTITRFRISTLKMDPRFGFLGCGRMWVWSNTPSFQILPVHGLRLPLLPYTVRVQSLAVPAAAHGRVSTFSFSLFLFN